jgi:pyrrolysyl-tRNA synthetase-like protein
MSQRFSKIQVKRLKELGYGPEDCCRQFLSQEERDSTFQQFEKQCIREERSKLQNLRDKVRRPRLCRLETSLSEVLATQGFVQVTTPIIMSKSMLFKMGIHEDHPFIRQVFWLNAKQCLRPMLAPHLYVVARNLLRLWEKPVRLFELGPCFRKESSGTQHSNEFTMLNMAEFGLPESRRHERIKELAAVTLDSVGISDYRFEVKNSEVYGETIDIVSGPQALEIGSSAMGPHPLDRQWRITTTWVGIGFGLERMLMAAEKYSAMGRLTRSLTYLDGIRLNI